MAFSKITFEPTGKGHILCTRERSDGSWGSDIKYALGHSVPSGLTHGQEEEFHIAMQLENQEACDHDWQELPGEPPRDVCNQCGKERL